MPRPTSTTLSGVQPLFLQSYACASASPKQHTAKSDAHVTSDGDLRTEHAEGCPHRKEFCCFVLPKISDRKSKKKAKRGISLEIPLHSDHESFEQPCAVKENSGTLHGAAPHGSAGEASTQAKEQGDHAARLVATLDTAKGRTALHIAALGGVKFVKALIQRGANVTAVDDGGRTPLHYACRCDHEYPSKMVRMLQKCAKRRDSRGRTPLHEAAANGRQRYVKELQTRRHRADVNAKDNNLCTPLHIACLEGHAECVKALLLCGASVSTQDAAGNSPLHIASYMGYSECALILVKEDADPNALGLSGRTPLHHAVAARHTKCVHTLLDFGARLDLPDEGGSTALHVAAYHGDEDLLKILLERGADPMAQDLQGCTALHSACGRGHVGCTRALRCGFVTNIDGWNPLHVAAFHGRDSCIQTLVSRGHDLDAQDARGYTALHFAIMKGHDACADRLIRLGANIHIVSHDGSTALLFAARGGHEELAMGLLLRGAKPDVYDSKGISAVHGACQSGLVRCLQIMAGLGASVSSPDAEGSTPLHVAAYFGQHSCVTTLVTLGAPVDSAGINGATPLHYASASGRVKCVEALALSGASIDAVDFICRTPLHTAALHGHTSCVTDLLARGAAHSSRDENGRVALHYACEGGDVKCMSSLLPPAVSYKELHSTSTLFGVSLPPWAQIVDAEGNTALHIAARCGHEQCVTFLLSLGCAVDVVDRLGRTSVHWACVDDQKIIVKTLVSRGADIERCDEDLHTPLHVAALCGSDACARLLLACGAKVDAKDVSKRTPLHIASVSGFQSTLQVLLFGGASVSSADKCGWTPLHYAAFNGHTAIVLALLQRGAVVNARDAKNRTPLHRACCGGHDACIQFLVDGGATVNATDDEDATPLHAAAYFGRVTSVKLILSLGAVVNSKALGGYTPLHVASSRGHTACVRTLIAAGAGINTYANDGSTPLSVAVCNGRIGVTEALLPHCGVITAIGARKLLREALGSGELEVVRHFVRGPTAQPRVVDEAVKFDDWRILVHAVRHAEASLHKMDAMTMAACENVQRTPHVVWTLCDKWKLSESWATVVSRLCAACYIGNANAVRTLMRCSEDPLLSLRDVKMITITANPLKQWNGVTALHTAAGSSSVSCVRLLHRPERVRHAAHDGSVPLHHAAHCASARTVLALCALGTEGTPRLPHLVRPFDISLRHDCVPICERLDVWTKEVYLDYEEMTSAGGLLMCRDDCRMPELPRLSITLRAAAGDHGFHCNDVSCAVERLIVENDNFDAADAILSLASLCGQCSVVHAIVESGCRLSRTWQLPDMAVCSAAAMGHTWVVEKLLQYGGVADADFCGATAVIHAASRGHTATVSVLLRFGAHPVWKWHGTTALHAAAVGGHAATVCVLGRYAARLRRAYIDALDGAGRTALHVACGAGHAKVAGVLLRLGADPDVLCGGCTALHLACRGGYVECVRLLVRFGANTRALTAPVPRGIRVSPRAAGHPSLPLSSLDMGLFDDWLLAVAVVRSIVERELVPPQPPEIPPPFGENCTPANVACHYSMRDCESELLAST